MAWKRPKGYSTEYYRRNKKRQQELARRYRRCNREKIRALARLRYYRDHKRVLSVKYAWRRKQARDNRERWQEKIQLYSRKGYQRHRLKRLAYARAKNKEERRRVIQHYGAKCMCCGETTFEFLTIDHINGGGNRQRVRGNLRGSAYYRWIIKTRFPEQLRVLCYNCNCSLGHYGYCPHKDIQALRA